MPMRHKASALATNSSTTLQDVTLYLTGVSPGPTQVNGSNSTSAQRDESLARLETLKMSTRHKASALTSNSSTTLQDVTLYLTGASPGPAQVNGSNSTSAQRDESLARLEILVQIVILVLALVGNSCVLTALTRRGKARSRMHMFIFHLSIADLLVAVFNILPQLIWDVTETFVGGDALCRFVKFMQVFVMYLSTYMLVMTAVDRYLSVCHPLSSFNTSSKAKVYAMIAFAYGLSAVLSLPQPIIFKYQEQLAGLNVYDCWAYFSPAWTLNLYVTSFTVAVYLVPLAILIYTYVSICYAIWQKHKHSQSQLQLDAQEMSIVTRPSLGEANEEAGDGREDDSGFGRLPGHRHSSCGSRTHSTSSSLDARAGAKCPCDVQGRSPNTGIGGGANRMTATTHHHVHHHHHHHHHVCQAQLQSGQSGRTPGKYCAGPGARCALVDTRTGQSPSSGVRDGSCKPGRSKHGAGSCARGKSQTNTRQFVARSNAIRRRANLVVTATNGSARSSTGSVRGLSRAKMKTVKLTFVVIVAYVLCWTPFFVSQLWWLYDESQESSCRQYEREHPRRLNKHVNNNSSNGENHNNDMRFCGEKLRRELRMPSRDVVCTAGIGVVPSIELRGLM
ncbi:hypothetical protein EGW08_001098 [Elysia chlorotica]|uniref:G-protein coupled receptors family 1 profile domain-containing protein n=1 Tax=Elysia chlorotica TaxID=188477 RepID=A0A3S1A145_ELYCH|nr:hypothetical protein EGW08_001098 [Elysia chlorotica]